VRRSLLVDGGGSWHLRTGVGGREWEVVTDELETKSTVIAPGWEVRFDRFLRVELGSSRYPGVEVVLGKVQSLSFLQQSLDLGLR